MEVLPALRPSELSELSVQVFSLSLWRSLFTWKLIQWRRDFSRHSIFHVLPCGVFMSRTNHFPVHHSLIILPPPSWPAYLEFPLFAATRNCGPFRHPSPANRPVAEARPGMFPQFNPLLISLAYSIIFFCLFDILSTTKITFTKIKFLSFVCKFSSYCAVNLLPFSCNKRGNVLINVTLRNLRITVFGMEKQ